MMSRMKGKLVPFAVFALYALITFNGQENPKHKSIAVSKTDPIKYLLCSAFDVADRIAPSGRKGNFSKNTNRKIRFCLLFLLSKAFSKVREIEKSLYL
jgi:hypothetical protein